MERPLEVPEHLGTISIRGLNKRFRSGNEIVNALDGVALEIPRGEFVVLLGPSGCGKTTLLRCLAGLERPDQGEIFIDGRAVFSSESGNFVSPERRHLSMVFQSYALWPHMRVFDNVAYPLKARGRAKRDEVRNRVTEALRATGCSGLDRRLPSELSGGQQQRVALARAIVARDPVVLFDEPLSNVDAKVREELRLELASMQRALGFTAIYVTHDQTEALLMGDRIAVMDRGRIVQLDRPATVYREPSSLYVANFIGKANFIPCVVDRLEAGRGQLTTQLGACWSDRISAEFTIGAQATLVVRPEHLRLAAQPAPAAIPGRVVRVSFLGTHLEYLLQCGSMHLVALASPSASLPFSEGDDVWIDWDPGSSIVFAGPHDGVAK